MDSEKYEIIVNVDNDALASEIAETNAILTEQVLVKLDDTHLVLTAINTSVTLVNVVLLGVFVYEYCKRVFKKKSVK